MVDLLSERDLVKLLQNGLVEPFADSIGLWRSGFGLSVINVVDGQVELIIVRFPVATVLSAPIRQYP